MAVVGGGEEGGDVVVAFGPRGRCVLGDTVWESWRWSDTGLVLAGRWDLG